MLSPIWVFLIPRGCFTPRIATPHLHWIRNLRAFYLMNFSIAALAFLLIFGCIICGLPICCVRHLDNKNRRPCHTRKRKFKTEPARNRGPAPWKRFFVGILFLTIIFLRVFGRIRFPGVFFSTCSTIMVLGLARSPPGGMGFPTPKTELMLIFLEFCENGKETPG